MKKKKRIKDEGRVEEYKVSATSKPSRLADAIVKGLKTGAVIDMYAIGPQAVNQAVKAAIIAQNKIKFICVPAFCEIAFGEAPKTGIKFRITA